MENTYYAIGENLLNEFYEDGIKGVIDGLNKIAPHIGRYIIEGYGQYFSNSILNHQQREMVTLATLISLGDCAAQLKWHINFSLNIGITPNQIIEIMTHCIPFSGFPRSLNAVNVAKQVFAEHGLVVEVIDELKNESAKFEKGMAKLEEIEGEHGRAVLATLESIAPKLGENIVTLTFGEIYCRTALTLKQRQLVTIGSLTAQGNCDPQLNVHIHTAFNVGLTDDEIIEAILQSALYVGFPKALNAINVLKKIKTS
ncbi:carboxymuconolactone decarboxylase family protein [Paenibacillus elgii]|uniref:carboxymuconolactone decarboxylase family protein n=1 Tax=Paenibacillus elgii TaxID=189691 RepID=UPI0013D21DF6|nr:carboxymuconolactone decarboxylase family protein [Paenibacillus elgii]